MLWRIEAPHFVAGLVVTDAHVSEAAPIIKYMRNWPFGRMLGYCQTKGWKLEKING